MGVRRGVVNSTMVRPFKGLNPPPTTTVDRLRKKESDSRTWMRIDMDGNWELLECNRHVIMNRARIPARDLRILGPVSYSSNILARESAIVINLEFIKAIVMAEEVYVLDPKDPLVAPFVEQLRLQLSSAKAPGDGSKDASSDSQKDASSDAPKGMMTDPNGPLWMSLAEESPETLPFEFKVLELSLEVVCKYLLAEVTELEHVTYPALEELTRNISTGVLERIRSLKSNLTHIAGRIQKVRDEIEHFLDDDNDMADMYLSRKAAFQRQQTEASVNEEADGTSEALGLLEGDDSVEDLEMLLETSFLNIDATRNCLVTIREYIDDTEDYVNIQLRNHRNQMIQLQMILVLAGFVIGLATAVSGVFGMNIPFVVDKSTGFVKATVGMLVGSGGVFFIVYGYARWKQLIGT